MEHVLGAARRLVRAEERLHREYFAAGPVDTSADGAFEVQLARSGKCCRVPADKTVLEVPLANGLDVPSSCEAGVCGTCLTRVIGGTPDHRDTFLTDDERRANDQFNPPARARSRPCSCSIFEPPPSTPLRGVFMSTTSIPIQPVDKLGGTGSFPLDQWYVAGFSSELKDQPVGRTFLNQKVVLFRSGTGEAAALEDRCCHRSLPLSCGTVEASGLRCGYHGLLYAPSGQCIEIPGQERIPSKAKVRSYHVVEKDHLLWIWMPRDEGAAPTKQLPDYKFRDDPRYKFGSGQYH